MCLFMPLLQPACLAQASAKWVRHARDQQGFVNATGKSLLTDTNGNLYAMGQAWAGSPIVKYNSSGDQLWLQRTQNQANKAFTLDPKTGIYVVGELPSIYAEYNPAYSTTRWDTAGNLLWEDRYDLSIDYGNWVSALTRDSKGNILVTGKSHLWETWFDIATIKYAPDGSRIWERRFGTGNGESDEATAIATDGADNIIVAGFHFYPHFWPYYESEYMVVKYDAAGNLLWQKRFEYSVDNLNEIKAMVLDASGNIYVTGKSSTGYATYKLDKDGNPLWRATLEGVGNNDGPGQGEGAVAIVLDGEGNCVVTGTNNRDYVTVKYAADGHQIWLRRYDGPANGTDKASHLGLDSVGNIYVTGQSQGINTGMDMATIKYSPDGTLQWVTRYDGDAGKDDDAAALAVIGNGELYVTGTSVESNNQRRFTTIRYSEQVQLEVNRLYLMDAATDQMVQRIEDGDEFNIAAFRGQKVNIMVTAGTVAAGSIVLELSGTQNMRRVENTAPFALMGNKGNNFYGWRPEPGDYTLTATPYPLKNGKGSPGKPTTIHFRVKDELTLNRFWLINATVNSNIRSLTNGSIIDLAQTPAINIRAERGTGYTESVKFGLNNQQDYRIENRPPFALASDNSGDFYPWQVTPGTYVITATPYGFNNAAGKAGTPLTISITVINSGPQATPAAITAKPAGTIQAGEPEVQVAPNPAGTFTSIVYRVPHSTTGTIQLFNQNGMLLQEVFRGHMEGNRQLNTTVQTAALPQGVYYLKLATKKGWTRTMQFIKQ